MDANSYESPKGDAAQPAEATPVAITSAPPEGFKDRSVGLALFGVVEILIGGFAALMVPMTIVSLSTQRAGGMGIRMLFPALGTYCLIAVLFVWLGVGSILARRWARALTLVIFWTWLVAGIVSMVVYVPIMFGAFSQIFRQAQVPAGAMAAGIVMGGGALGCLYVLLPGAFVLFYQSPHVKATCESRDPRVRWTDKCPLPVLALSLLLGFSAYTVIWSAACNPAFPLFGFLLRGIPGAALYLLNGILLCWLAVGVYRLKTPAWWGTLALYGLWYVSTILTFSRVSMMEYYRGMDFPEEQMKMAVQMAGAMSVFMTWGMTAFLALFVGYLTYVRKYFVARRPRPGERGSPQSE